MNPIVHYIKDQLKDIYPDGELTSIIKIILTEVFQFTTIELYCGKDRSFSDMEKKKLDSIIARLSQKEPIQYIIGYEIFHNLRFYVNKSTLIPRPETDELVNWILSSNRISSPKILDIGTGSGCIAVSLAHDLTDSTVEAWDISQNAVETAQTNASDNDVKVDVKVQDLFDSSIDRTYKGATEEDKFDIIVSNPPYIMYSEKSGMDKNVIEWEPSSALFVPDSEPLLFYRRIAELGVKMLKNGGHLYFEINQRFGKEMIDLLKSVGYKEIELSNDFYDNDRMIKAML